MSKNNGSGLICFPQLNYKYHAYMLYLMLIISFLSYQSFKMVDYVRYLEINSSRGGFKGNFPIESDSGVTIGR